MPDALNAGRIAAARAYFPRGLIQPPGSARFSADALLLAAFACRCLGARRKAARVLELGAGCGAASLSFLLNFHSPSFLHSLDPATGQTLTAPPDQVTGLEKDATSAAAARENALRLGLADRFAPVIGDVRTSLAAPGVWDAVLMNPPYRDPAAGRVPCGPRRACSLFADQAGVEEFVAAAVRALTARGRVFCVFGAGRAALLFACLARCGLTVKRMRWAHGHARAQAKILLLEARKNGRPGLIVDAPLLLYEPGQPGQRSALTPDALAFCPALGCNRRSG